MAVRFLIATALMLPWATKVGGGWKFFNNRQGLLLGGVLFVAAALQQIGIVTTSASKAGFITGLYVAFVPILSMLFLRHRESRRQWIAVAFAAIGMYLLSGSRGEQLVVGDWWVLASALAFAVHVLLIGRFAVGAHPVVLAVVQYAITGVCSLVAALMFETIDAPVVLQAWPSYVYAALFSTCFAYTAQLFAQRHTTPTRAGIIMSTEAAFAALFGVTLLHETLLPMQWVGCGVMFFGCLLTQLPQKG